MKRVWYVQSKRVEKSNNFIKSLKERRSKSLNMIFFLLKIPGYPRVGGGGYNKSDKDNVYTQSLENNI
jgi:hypothetical protein